MQEKTVKELMFWTAKMAKGFTDSGKTDADIVEQVEKKYAETKATFRMSKPWISVSVDSDYDGIYLGYIEKYEECGAINYYQRTVINSMNKWVLQEGERLLFWMELPTPPSAAREAEPNKKTT